eukprot:1431342-Rhodomonas_salina.5
MTLPTKVYFFAKNASHWSQYALRQGGMKLRNGEEQEGRVVFKQKEEAKRREESVNADADFRVVEL